MEEIIQKQADTIFKFYEQKLFPILFKRIEDHHETILKIDTLQKELKGKSYRDKSKAVVLSELKSYKEDLENSIDDYFNFEETKEEESFFTDFYTALDTYISSLDVTITRPQERERFYTQKTDTKLLKFKKALKRIAFKTSKLPVKLFNVFRKNKKEIHFWNQTIPFQNLTHYYFKTVLTKEIKIVIDAIYKEISKITHVYWSTDKAIDQKITSYINEDKEIDFSEEAFPTIDSGSELNSRIEKHRSHLTTIFNEVGVLYIDALYKVDTLELSSSKFSNSTIQQSYKIAHKATLKNELQWHNTFKVLASDWELDIEIFSTIFKVLTQYLDLENEITSRSSEIKKELVIIKDYVDTAKKKIENTNSDTEIKQAIVDELNSLGRTFKKIIAATTRCVSNQELPVLINEFEENDLSILKNISTKRAITDGNDYTVPTPSSNINYISPYELITYESWPKLAEKIQEDKVELTVKVNDFIDDVHALSQVTEFNLESALSLFDDVSQDNTPKKVALDGFTRTSDKVQDLENVITEINETNRALLLAGIEKFNKSILALTETENIIEIRLTIAKAKSIEKSKQLRKKVLDTLKNFIPIAIAFSTTQINTLKKYVKGFLLRSGLYKEPMEINSELSNFLKEAEKALAALPYVYQRLFRSETLQNDELFIGRTESLDILNSAYTAFTNEQYSATIITGERGAGKTSLIHYFLQKSSKIPKTIFTSPTETISTQVAFYEFLKTSFSKDFESNEQWIEFFNKGKKKIIIIENVQFLYSRKVNGFEALDQLLELISATNKSVLWILTCSKHAFQYLNKSIQLSEYFSFTVEMYDIDKQTMTEALIKRHKISGYNLHFEKPPVAYLTKKFLKSTTDVQQQLLREEFFSDINKIAQSNFKIAFMYWIRSATSVSGSTINMRSLKTMDLSFLNKLAPAKLMLLNIILLQERLKLDDIIELMSLDDQQVKRMIHSLYEDGLLILDEDHYYTINILLYRQITALLKSKNLIH